MSMTNALMIQVGKTRRVRDMPLPNRLADLNPSDVFSRGPTAVFSFAGSDRKELVEIPPMSARELLFMTFITDLTIADKFGPIADSFPLLHGALSVMSKLHRQSDFVLQISDEWDLIGKANGAEAFALQITANTDSIPPFDIKMSTSQLMISLAGLVSDLERSISASGFPAWESFAKFPVDFGKN